MELIFWLWVVNPLEKVFQNTLPQDNAPKALYLECAANEYEAAQFAIRSQVKLEDVSIELTDLVNEESGYEISSENLQWNFVGFIPIEKNSPGTPEEELLRKAPSDIPDPLLDAKNLAIDADRTQPVWITVYAPNGTPPGIYHGKANVITSAGEIAIPIELTVYPFELPEKRHLFVTNWFNTGNNAPLNSIRWEMLREGLEDYEYLWLLESKTEQIQEKLGIAAKSIPSDFRSKEICGKLVKSFTEHAKEPDVFYSAKRQLSESLR